jgi:hypothetical protein
MYRRPTKRFYLRVTTLLVTAMLLQSGHYPGGVALAQETRAETIAQQQENKSAGLTPEAPTRGEHIFLETKRRFIDERDGFYPLLGSIYAGGGLSLGGGYRRYYADWASGVRVVYGRYETTNWRKSSPTLQVMQAAGSIFRLKPVGLTPHRSATTDWVLHHRNVIARITDSNVPVQVLE